MVNYKRVVCEVALLATLTVVASAPTDCADRHYDQRQNGTENYRLNIDGVVIAVAPAESLLAAASDIDFSSLLDFEDFAEVGQKPKPPADNKPQDVKPEAAGAPKPDEPLDLPQADAPAPPKSDLKSEKKEVSQRKHEKTQRWVYLLLF